MPSGVTDGEGDEISPRFVRLRGRRERGCTTVLGQASAVFTSQQVATLSQPCWQALAGKRVNSLMTGLDS